MATPAHARRPVRPPARSALPDLEETAAARGAPPATPVELAAPDITRWRDGNTGVDYAHGFESGRPGPHALVTAIVHGNEIGGAIALDRLLHAGPRPRRGRLTLAFANVAAYGRFDSGDPTASRFVDEDLNRVWSPAALDGPRQSVELRRARALRPLVEAAGVLLDLHSLQQGDDPLAFCGPLKKGRALAWRVGRQKIEVTHAVTVESPAFAFAAPYRGLEVIAAAGTEIARDGARPVRTPYDDCVVVMPSRRLVPGQTAIRLGRWVA